MCLEWTAETSARKRKTTSGKWPPREVGEEAVPPWSVPTEVLIMALFPGCNSVRDQERRGIGCPEINAAMFRLCGQLLWEVHLHGPKGENGTGPTPTITSRARQTQR